MPDPLFCQREDKQQRAFMARKLGYGFNRSRHDVYRARNQGGGKAMIDKLQETLDLLEKANDILSTCEKPAGKWAETNLQRAIEKIGFASELVTIELANIEKCKMYLAKGGTVWPGVIEP
jgi:hypothetical protein